MTHQEKEVSLRPSRRRIVVLLGALAALGPFSIDTYLPAFPEIASTFGVPSARVGDTLAAYFLGISVGQLAYGPWMARAGRRKPLLWGLGLYVLASIACATASGFQALVALRLLQALGGCAGMVASRALVRDLFPSEAAQVFSSLMLVMGVAPLVAPTVGGWLAALAGWRSIFLFLAVLGAVLVVVLWRNLPESIPAHSAGASRPGAILRGWWEIVRHPEFVVWGIGGSIASGGLYAYLAGSPGAYMQGLGLDGSTYAWVFAVNAGGMILASQFNRPLLRRFSGERIVLSAFCLQILSIVVLIACASMGIRWTAYPLAWLFLFAHGLSNPNVAALVLRPFGHDASNASALMGSFQMASGALLAGLVGILPLPPLLAMGTGMVAATGCALLVIASGWCRRGGCAPEPVELPVDLPVD
jgi:DHA1 family bicyclomycin/chloramphenicol resistance-like MFS transporter